MPSKTLVCQLKRNIFWCGKWWGNLAKSPKIWPRHACIYTLYMCIYIELKLQPQFCIHIYMCIYMCVYVCICKHVHICKTYVYVYASLARNVSIWRKTEIVSDVQWFVHIYKNTHLRGALQCIALCWSVLQCVASYCSVVQCGAMSCSVLQCVAVWGLLRTHLQTNTFQWCIAMHHNVLR